MKWSRRRRSWFGLRSWVTLPLVVSVLVVTVVGFTLKRHWETTAAREREETMAQALEQGSAALSREELTLAGRHFQVLLDAHQRSPQPTDSAVALNTARQVVTSLHLLQDSLDRALADVSADPIQRRHLLEGKGILLDAYFLRSPSGRIRVDFHPTAGDKHVVIEIGEPSVLNGFPLTAPTRLLLSVNLLELAASDDHFILRVDPKSVALVTEPALLRALGFSVDDLLSRARAQRDALEKLHPEGR